MRQLHELYNEAYDLFDSHLSEVIEELSKDKRELRILDIGTGCHPRYLFHLSKIAKETNISIDFVCIDKARIKLDEYLGSFKYKCIETHNKVIVLNEDINISNSGKIKITKSVKDLAPFDIVLINATVHELHVNYAIDDYFPQFFESLSGILTKSGLLFIGDYYFPSYMTYYDRRRMVELQYQESNHADPPEAFIEPDLLSKYFISYFNVLQHKQILLSPYDDKDLKKLYYVFVLKKNLLKNKSQIRVFRDKIDLILENIDDSNIHKHISKFTENIEIYKASSNSENFDFEDFYKDFYRGDLFKSIAELVNKFIFEWNEYHGFNNLPKNSIWISYNSQFLKGNESRIDPMYEEGGVSLKYPYCFSDKTTISDFKNDLSFIAFNNFLNWDKIKNDLSKNHFRLEQMPSIYKWMIEIGKDDFLSVNVISTDTNLENPENRFLAHIENNKRAKHNYVNLYENDFLSWDNELAKSLPNWDDQTNIYKYFLWSIFKDGIVKNAHDNSSSEYYYKVWNSFEKPDYSYKFFSTLNLKLPNDTPLGTIMIFSDTVFDSKLLDSLIIILNRYFVKLNHIDTELNSYINYLKEKKYVKESEWKNVIQQLRHNIITHLSYLPYAESEEERSIILKDIQSYLMLTKFQTEEQKKEFIEQQQRKIITIDKIIDPIINMLLKIIDENITILGGKNAIHKALISNKKSFFTYENHILSNVKCEVITEIARLIFKDLITNAIKNVDPENPICEVHVSQINSMIEVKISNNSIINLDYYDQIKRKETIIPEEPEHWGIYIYKQYIKLLNWEIDILDYNEIIETRRTTIYVRIPIKKISNVENTVC